MFGNMNDFLQIAENIKYIIDIMIKTNIKVFNPNNAVDH